MISEEELYDDMEYEFKYGYRDYKKLKKDTILKEMYERKWNGEI